MSKSQKSKIRTTAPKGAGRGDASPLLSVFHAEVENVQYFLRALNQISLALDALGYKAEGDALAQVKIDLHQRIFGMPDLAPSIVADLH